MGRLPSTADASPGAVSQCAMHWSRFPESPRFRLSLKPLISSGRATNCQCPLQHGGEPGTPSLSISAHLTSSERDESRGGFWLAILLCNRQWHFIARPALIK